MLSNCGAGEDSWELLDSKEIKPVNPKGNHLEGIFIGRTYTEAEAALIWPPEIKRPLLLGRKVMTNLDSVFKSRDITLPTKVHLVKAMVFPVVMYGCESWTVKKAECRRIDALELWCWRRNSWESLGLQGNPTSPFWRRLALGFLWKEWC